MQVNPSAFKSNKPDRPGYNVYSQTCMSSKLLSNSASHPTSVISQWTRVVRGAEVDSGEAKYLPIDQLPLTCVIIPIHFVSPHITLHSPYDSIFHYVMRCPTQVGMIHV